MQTRSKILGILVILAISACSAGTASAQLNISRFTVDGGGGGSVGGSFALGGTAGQADAGRMSGASFTISGGFWAGGGGVPTSVEDGTSEDNPSSVPLAFRLLPVSPNPVTGSMVLAFDLPESRFVRAEIYDAAGRLVRVLANDLLAAGRNQRVWDRRDQRSVLVPAGIYFVRFDAGVDQRRQKFVVVS